MENKHIQIIYEDEVLLVVNKPAGIPVHEDGRETMYTLVDWVRETRPEMEEVGETMVLQNGKEIHRPGVVHRLDMDTSGVLVLAKTQDAFAYIKEQFKNRNTEKEYRAFVWGEIQEVTGTVDKPIGRSQKDFRLWTTHVPKGKKVREAVTRWMVRGTKNGFSYLSLMPKTGRTHQIRVHMKAIGHPVVGDTRYAPDKKHALGFTRHALHAFAITLSHPNGATMVFEAPLPEDFLNAQKELFGAVDKEASE